MQQPDSAMTANTPPKWAVAVFAARESVETIETTIEAINQAVSENDCRIAILVNGNKNLADQLSRRFQERAYAPPKGIRIDIWFLEVGDKAQTWNAYVHRLYPGGELTFFVDGYAAPKPDALRLLSHAISKSPQSLAVSGVPSCGSSARRQAAVMLHSGGIHGNLFALPKRTMEELRQRAICLPKGLYRTDSLIGAILNFRFDPSKYNWDPGQILVQGDATWKITPLRWWHPGDIRTHVTRVLRQSKGQLENLAVSDHLGLHRRSPESLPPTARELVLEWWHGNTGPTWRRIMCHPGWLLALRRMREIRDWSRADEAPRLIGSYPLQ